MPIIGISARLILVHVLRHIVDLLFRPAKQPRCKRSRRTLLSSALKCLTLLCFLGCAGCTGPPVEGRYCRTRQDGEECLNLTPDGMFTQVFRTADTTFTYAGNWHLEGGGGRIVLRLLRDYPTRPPAQEQVSIVNVVMGYQEIIMDEDQEQDNYKKVRP